MSSDFLWVDEVVGCGWRLGAVGPDEWDCFTVVEYGFKRAWNVNLELPQGASVEPLAFDRAVNTAMQVGGWRRVAAPVAGCVVFMSRSVKFHHMGMWVPVNGGRVLHAAEGVGVRLEPLRSITGQYQRVEFWLYECVG